MADSRPFLPPRWFIRLAWAVHRAIYRVTGGRRGLRPPTPRTYGMMRIHTIAAGMPSYGVGGMAIDQDDVRAHGKDERVRITSFYEAVEFYYRYLKALTTRD